MYNTFSDMRIGKLKVGSACQLKRTVGGLFSTDNKKTDNKKLLITTAVILLSFYYRRKTRTHNDYRERCVCLPDLNALVFNFLQFSSEYTKDRRIIIDIKRKMETARKSDIKCIKGFYFMLMVNWLSPLDRK